MKGLWLAVGLLTALPVQTAAPQPGDVGRAGKWFPLIGLTLGATVILALALFGLLFSSPPLAVTCVVAVWAGITGGLHLDGLADCCDGMIPPGLGPPERRLEIMGDPRLGAFGGIGLTLFIILKILAVIALNHASGDVVFSTTTLLFPLLLAPALARWLVLLVAIQPSARPGGMGADFALGLTRSVFVFAALVPLALFIAGLLFASPWRTIIAVALAHLVTVAIIRLAHARLGGVTGDVFGLTVELAELTVLLTFAARSPLVP